MPAATLLLPYFEVDPNNASGLTTLFAINNSGAAAVLANVEVWTDLGVPTLGFQVYLTGYDVQTINLRDVFNGSLPQTAPAGQDPQDTISPKGLYSQDLNFASCTQLLPYQPLPASFVAHLRAAHSGQFSALLNGCAGQDLGDGRLRGYITVDTVSGCTLRTPADPGYFGAGGVATIRTCCGGTSSTSTRRTSIRTATTWCASRRSRAPSRRATPPSTGATSSSRGATRGRRSPPPGARATSTAAPSRGGRT